MSNLNPLSVHKDLGLVLGYDDLKNPTKEVIKYCQEKEGIYFSTHL